MMIIKTEGRWFNLDHISSVTDTPNGNLKVMWFDGSSSTFSNEEASILRSALNQHAFADAFAIAQDIGEPVLQVADTPASEPSPPTSAPEAPSPGPQVAPVEPLSAKRLNMAEILRDLESRRTQLPDDVARLQMERAITEAAVRFITPTWREQFDITIQVAVVFEAGKPQSDQSGQAK